tara:strand:+ start:7902 stop:8339 length:438 start_codon:yes stop_codon:yes gene_type:complete
MDNETEATDLIVAGMMKTSLRLMTIADLVIELEYVIWACREHAYPHPPFDDDEFEALISNGLPAVGQVKDNDSAWLTALKSRERQMVGLQAHRVKKILDHQHLYQLRKDLPQYALVPQDWVKRMQLLLGQSTAPLATIQFPDALQ